jgi:hypothetical protein
MLVYFKAISNILGMYVPRYVRLGIFYVHLVFFMFIWYFLCSFGIFYVHLVFFMFIWYILWSFGIFLPFW